MNGLSPPVGLVEIVVDGFEEDPHESRPPEHAGVVEGIDATAVCRPDPGPALDEVTGDADGPALVLDEGGVDEGCPAGLVTLVDAVTEAHEEPDLLEEPLRDGRVDIQLHGAAEERLCWCQRSVTAPWSLRELLAHVETSLYDESTGSLHCGIRVLLYVY